MSAQRPRPPPWPTGNTDVDKKARSQHLNYICSRRMRRRLGRLLESGWDVNECYYTNPWAEGCHHALTIAVWHSWEEGVAMLLEAGATPRKTRKQCSLSPIIPDAVINFCNAVMATRCNTGEEGPDAATDPEENLKIMRMLIDHKCDVNSAGEDGLPLLHITARCPDIRALKLLLSAGAKINVQNDRASAKGRSPLTKAVDVNNLAAVKLLIQYGASLSVRCTAGPVSLGRRSVSQTLLARSLDLGNFDVAETLVKAGCLIGPNDVCAIQRHLGRAIRQGLPGNSGNATQDDGWETEEEEEVLESSSDDDDVNNSTESDEARKRLQSEDGRRNVIRDRQGAVLCRLAEMVTQPQPLKRLCRNFIRQRQGLTSLDQIRQLPVPRVLKEFILCRDL